MDPSQEGMGKPAVPSSDCIPLMERGTLLPWRWVPVLAGVNGMRLAVYWAGFLEYPQWNAVCSPDSDAREQGGSDAGARRGGCVERVVEGVAEG